MLRPFRFILVAEIAAEGLFAPVAVARVGDGSEGGNGFVFVGVFKELSWFSCVSRSFERDESHVQTSEGPRKEMLLEGL